MGAWRVRRGAPFTSPVVEANRTRPEWGALEPYGMAYGTHLKGGEEKSRRFGDRCRR
ncbi:hypothetical protein GCM10025857_05840 [Alicyclobacillus contaminans]|nr:hypothetical protein GCM10025857_05840 [Alicyclobacillus contaminans]